MPKLEQNVFGAPCWVDLTNTNLEASKPFYSAVFGWTFTEMGEEFGNYNIISVGEDAVGGAMQYSADFMGPSPINTWSVYFATQDAAASLKAAEKARGTQITPPMQVAEQGTMAEATDATGTQFGLWQPDERLGFDRFGEHGFPAWFELHTRDFDAASSFYSTVLGAELGADEMTQGMNYHTLQIGGDDKAGIWDINGIMPDEEPTGWFIYFYVDDADAAVAAIREHGGTVTMEPEDSEYGRRATALDPAGAAFNIISNMPS